MKETIYPIYQSWCFRNPVDLIETEDMFVAEIELPGYTKNDINVSVNGLTVEVSASKEREEISDSGENIQTVQAMYNVSR